MGIRHAFLLGGLLRYAGDAWHGERLAPWKQSCRLLCDDVDDTRGVYRELHAAGWLNLSADSPLSAFELGPAATPSFDALEVSWSIAADRTGGLPSQILDFAQSTLEGANGAELRPIWEWVSFVRASKLLCVRLRREVDSSQSAVDPSSQKRSSFSALEVLPRGCKSRGLPMLQQYCVSARENE